MPAGMPDCMTCCGRWRRRAEKKKSGSLFSGAPFCSFGRPPGRGSVSCVLLDALQQRIPLHKRGGGIVLTIPITGLQRPMLQLLNDQVRETIEQKIEERVDSDMSDMQTSAGYTAIWVALSNGYSSDAIDAARSAGAMGGTILKGRRQNSERISQKLGISMQEEEEFVVIVTPREKKAAVMNAISDACGLRTDAHGIILSLPVDEVIGLETGENML